MARPNTTHRILNDKGYLYDRNILHVRKSDKSSLPYNMLCIVWLYFVVSYTIQCKFSKSADVSLSFSVICLATRKHHSSFPQLHGIEALAHDNAAQSFALILFPAVAC